MWGSSELGVNGHVTGTLPNHYHTFHLVRSRGTDSSAGGPAWSSGDRQTSEADSPASGYMTFPQGSTTSQGNDVRPPSVLVRFYARFK